MAAKVRGLVELKQTLSGIAADFTSKAGATLAARAYGYAVKQVPVDTGHMRRQTTAVRTGANSWELRTDTPYAMEQYSKTRMHLFDGAYHSISRATVPISESLQGEIKKRSIRGSIARQSVYWEKYAALKAAGRLVPTLPKWFEKGVKQALDPAIREMRAHFTAVARANARAGRY